jgi:hypothetical protein
MTGLVTRTLTDRSAHEILVVDDNPATCYATARVLRAAGFRTREAGTGTEALNQLGTGISAVILDVHLPDIDGFEVCGRIRTRPDTALLPVIHLSASHVLDHDKVRGLDAGADAYMTHPAEPALLVATLQALIRARAAEERMRRSDADFRAIYDQAPSGIALLDARGRFTEVNPAMLAILQREQHDVIGRSLADLAREHAGVPTEAIPAFADDGEASLAFAADGVWRGEFPLVTGAGGLVHLSWSLSTKLRPGAILAIATDISERIALSQQREALLEREQAARETAERLSLAKDEFIAVLSHELRTPLNAIVGWVEVLQRFASHENLSRGLAAIQRNAKIQARLISDILEMSRARLGKLRLELEPTDVAEVVGSSLAAMAEALRDKQLSVDFVADGHVGSILADTARVQQIVWNLLSNAIKFSTKGGRIRVSTWRSDGCVILVVEDDGRGIAPEFLPHVFDRFAQSDPSSNRRHGGLGLGLSIVRQLAELHGGSVAAYSAGLEQGAKFVVRFPIEAVGRAAAPATSVFGELSPPSAQGRLAGMHIAIVDDDADAREILGLVLREQGARVSEAADHDDALRQMDAELPNALVSDIGLPGADGYALIQEARRRYDRDGRRLAAVALTAFARPKDRDAALAAGFDEHCSKPIEPGALIGSILAAVGRAS